MEGLNEHDRSEEDEGQGRCFKGGRGGGTPNPKP